MVCASAIDANANVARDTAMPMNQFAKEGIFNIGDPPLDFEDQPSKTQDDHTVKRKAHKSLAGAAFLIRSRPPESMPGNCLPTYDGLIVEVGT
jgi:hypothetical protein